MNGPSRQRDIKEVIQDIESKMRKWPRERIIQELKDIVRASGKGDTTAIELDDLIKKIETEE